MRLAISNIAWAADQEAAAADLLVELGVEGVEVAPTRVWPHPLEVSDADLRAYRGFWERRGIAIVALQALLFEKPGLRIFQDAREREEAIEYLSGIIRLAGQLGARALVFGSPKNRRVDSLPGETVRPLALDFFGRLAEVAAKHSCVFCIEPNPACYGCDYVTHARDGLELVRQVHHPSFGLHLDAAGMSLSADPVEEVFRQARGWWHHFHISEPFLAPVGEGSTPHGVFAERLRACRYDGWTSIEMKPASQGPFQDHVGRALAFARQTYRPGPRAVTIPANPMSA